MDELKSNLAQSISSIIGVEVDASHIELANPKAGSHLALPCFKLAAELGRSPIEIADQIATDVDEKYLMRTSNLGPYVNFWLDPSYLINRILSGGVARLQDADMNGKTAIIEFLSMNLAKPLSIGHLRNVLQGRALVRVYENAGYKVITDNHVGDWGTVFGMWVVGFTKFSSDKQLAEAGVEELGRMYVEMRKALKDEEGSDETPLRNEVQEWLHRLEASDKQAWEYHDRFSKVSLGNVTSQMSDLGIKFDHNLGESFYIKRGKELVTELVKSGKATKNDDGSVVIPLDAQGIDVPMLIEKSNGAALYHTSDIATIEYREKTWDPDEVIYVVASEQAFHFRQLFAANKILGWSDAELVHHSYGLIEEVDEDGKRSKMSSRNKAIYMADLLKLAIARAAAIAPDGLSGDDVKKVAYGALSFQEFAASHQGNTVFDWGTMFSLSGFSGPYVQYAVVRANSILEKSETVASNPPDGYDWTEHADILWLLNRYESVVSEVAAERELHKLAEYSYELARAFNRLYEATPILKSEGNDLVARLWLVGTIGAHLERSLYLLGIEIPSKM